MSVDVVLDHPHRYIHRRLARVLWTTAGLVLLGVGFIASAPASVLTFALPFLVFLSANSHDDTFSASVPWGTLVPAWVGSLVLAIVASGVGLSMLRRKRRMVLFLRRFGYSDATEAVTAAAASSAGQAWRLVTLDDSEVKAIGLPTATRLTYRGVGAVAGGAIALVLLAARILKYAFWPAVAALFVLPLADIALGSEKARRVAAAGWGSFLHTLAIDHRLPAHLQPDSHLAFLAALAIVIVVIAGGIGYFVALIGAMVMMGPLVFAKSAITDLGKVEAEKTIEVGGAVPISQVVQLLRYRSRSVYAPHLTVVKVPSSMWHDTVRELVRLSDVVLVDVSVPTQSLVWEVTTLLELHAHLQVVGEYQHVRKLFGLDGSPVLEGTNEAQLTRLLDGNEVLAYTTDRAGRQRFTRELADAFESAIG
jgi:hypothetical protein